MWFKVILASILTAFFSFSIFTVAADDNTTQNQTMTQSADTQQNAAQILGTLMVIDKNEINTGKLAESQSSNADVKKFAKQMQKDHSQNVKEAEKLADKLAIKSADSDLSNNLQKEGDDEAAKLKTLSGDQFNQEYTAAMVKGHQAALNFLDQAISQVNNSELVKFLKNTRATVAHHLEMAQKLSKKINNS